MQLVPLAETALDVARAMAHLHQHNIVHSDLKARNVLLRSDMQDPRGFTAKVADFGLSLTIDPNSTHISNAFQVSWGSQQAVCRLWLRGPVWQGVGCCWWCCGSGVRGKGPASSTLRAVPAAGARMMCSSCLQHRCTMRVGAMCSCPCVLAAECSPLLLVHVSLNRPLLPRGCRRAR